MLSSTRMSNSTRKFSAVSMYPMIWFCTTAVHSSSIRCCVMKPSQWNAVGIGVRLGAGDGTAVGGNVH